MELKFNSQVCTTVEQSKKLLELGLKPETADMHHTNASLPYNKDEFHSVCLPPPAPLNRNYKAIPQIDSFVFIPAWSLHRLLLMLYDREDLYPIMPTTAYDDIVDEIENSIERGYFNKEHLNE